jgi:hypothetical protein
VDQTPGGVKEMRKRESFLRPENGFSGAKAADYPAIVRVLSRLRLSQ